MYRFGFLSGVAVAVPNTRVLRLVIYVQLTVAIMAVTAGVSETNPHMAWGGFLFPAVPVFMVAVWVCPWIVLSSCVKQRRMSAIWAAAASIALSAMTFYGLLPLVQ